MSNTPRRRRIAALGLGVTLAVGALIGASPTTAVAVDNGYYTVIVTDQDHYEGQTWTAFQMQDEGINAGPAPENFSEYDTSTMTEAFAVNASVPENFRYNGGAKAGHSGGGGGLTGGGIPGAGGHGGGLVEAVGGACGLCGRYTSDAAH